MKTYSVLKTTRGSYLRIKNHRKPYMVDEVVDINEATVFSNKWVNGEILHALKINGFASSWEHFPVRIERKIIPL